MNESTRAPSQFLVNLIKFGNKVQLFQTFLGVAFVLCFFSFVIIDVASRTMMRPVIWAQEIAILGFIWAIMIGSGIMMRKGKHFKIDIVVTLLSERGKNILNIIKLFIIMAFAIFLIWSGMQFAMFGIARVSIPSGIQLIFWTVSFPVSGVFFLYYVLEGIISNVNGWEVSELIKYSNPNGEEQK